MNAKEQIAHNLFRELCDRGQIVEGGWRAYELLTGLSNAGKIQRDECRKAWFFGADHVFSSMLTMIDAGEEPTQNDLERMDKLDTELKNFKDQFGLKP